MSQNGSMKLQTTTWPLRHQVTFGDLSLQLKKCGIDKPRVVEVGPGAVTQFLSKYLEAGDGDDLSWWANRVRAVLRNVDGLLRRIPNISLCSYEPGELLRALPDGSELTVADISWPVIEAIRRQYPQIDAEVIDFSTQTVTPPVDVIVCLCVLVRAEYPKKIFANLYRSLSPGGLLVMDNRSCTNFGAEECPLTKLAAQVWRKPIAPTVVD